MFFRNFSHFGRINLQNLFLQSTKNVNPRSFGPKFKKFSEFSQNHEQFKEIEREDAFGDDSNLFHKCADETLHQLLEKLEELESLNIPNFDVFEHDGVLELNLGDSGTYIINKQSPNKQIWYSSPISGPKRFYYDKKKEEWCHTRDGQTLKTLLSTDISKLLSINFKVH
eukprot:TRINITY_DN7980_c0_g1_i1.p1 TRINITY_DN7980_c0_g1~~TRINITY_DN7980_c0_g1_i1.p1  ORF type:complete len:186 (+),score=31.32 TRINITY_DN7980_c0_g1_i1:54-560(+)